MAIQVRTELCVTVSTRDEADLIMNSVVSGEAERILKHVILDSHKFKDINLYNNNNTGIDSVRNDTMSEDNKNSTAKNRDNSLPLKAVKTKSNTNFNVESKKETNSTRSGGILGRRTLGRTGGR